MKSRLPAKIVRLRSEVSSFAGTERGRMVLKVARLVLVAGIIGLLIAQLTGIGWRSILTSLPTTPWFYVIFVVMYFLLPVFEVAIYSRLWPVRVFELLRVLVRKRVLNNEVVGYSGELYLYFWARKRAGVGDRRAFACVKDNAIASSFASTTALVLIVTGFVLGGQVVLVDVIGQRNVLYVLIALGGFVVIALAATRFHRTLFSLGAGVAAALFGTHLLRFILIYSLQMLQWYVVLPEAPLSVWATILVVSTLTSRIPFLPARDLFAIGAVLGVSHLLDASQATIAGMLMTRSALDKLLNVTLFATTSWYDDVTPPADAESELREVAVEATV